MSVIPLLSARPSHGPLKTVSSLLRLRHPLPLLQWYSYAVPVLGSIGSVLLGVLATVFISSKTNQMHAWLTSLNDSSRRSSSSSYSSSPRRERVPSAVATSPDKISNMQADHAKPNSGDGAADAGQVGVGTEIATLELANVNAAGGGEGGGGREGAVGEGSKDRLSKGVGGDSDGGGGPDGWVGTGDRVLLAMALALSLLFAYLSSAIGSSDLLGCFFGGVAFSGVPGVGRVWERQVRRFRGSSSYPATSRICRSSVASRRLPWPLDFVSS